jgi:hypothetical protein
MILPMPIRIITVLFLCCTFTTLAATSACIAVPPGLVGWWPGDTNENDIAGGNNPSAVSAVSLVPGEVLNGFSFGTNGYIQIPPSSALANQNFTWAAWVRPDGPGPNNDQFGNKIIEQNIDFTSDSVALNWSALTNRFILFLAIWDFPAGELNSCGHADVTSIPRPDTLSRKTHLRHVTFISWRPHTTAASSGCM